MTKNSFHKSAAINLIEKLIKMMSQIISLVFIARIMGPESIGVLTYCLAISTVFIFLNNLGLDALLVNILIKEKTHRYSYLKSAFFIRLISSLACILLINLIGMVAVNESERSLLFLISLSHLFMAFTVFEWHCQAVGMAFISAAGAIPVHITGLIFRIYCLIYEKELLWIGATYLLEAALLALIYSILFRANFAKDTSFKASFISMQLIRSLIVKSLPLILSGAVIILYMKIDQVMIGLFSGMNEVGVYVAATRLSEAWYFIGITLISIYFPKYLLILKKHGNDECNKFLVSFGKKLFQAAVLLACLTSVFSDLIISIFYGPTFSESSRILALVIWTVPLVFIGSLSSRLYIVRNQGNLILYRSISGLILNVILNLLLIPNHGAYGAAIATVASQFFTSFIANFFLSRGYVHKINIRILTPSKTGRITDE